MITEVFEVSRKRQLLNTIVARASYPTERLVNGLKYDTPDHEHTAQEHLKYLYSVVRASDEEKRTRFLAHLKLNEVQLLQALSLPAAADQVTNSSWSTLLLHILTEYTDDPILCDQVFYPGHPLPFEELLYPFMRYARQKIQNQVPDYTFVLNANAQKQLEYWLLAQLSSLAGEPLVLEFVQFRDIHDEAATPDEQQQVLYKQFLNQYAGERFLIFFAEYSVLARLLVQRVEQWIEACVEFVERVKADSDLISHTFFSDRPSGPIVDILPGCSDAHRYGHTVFLFAFADARKLVYKPRCMEVDEAFALCIEWLNKKGLPLGLKCARILNRGTYGWMEYIERIGCTTATEVHTYYQRCGLLIGLFYVLGSVDIHYENLIAHGAYPIPIDLETILSPLLRDFSSNALTKEQKNGYSVARSMMLPSKTMVQGHELDLTVLGEGQVSIQPERLLGWQYINTDAMTLAYQHLSANTPTKHKVTIDGTITKSLEYVEDMVIGFCAIYHFLIEHRTEILADGSMLSFFVGCPIRYVYRPTSIYARHMGRLQSFDFLRDGTRRWIDSQIFKRVLLQDQADQRLWTLASGEMAAMEQQDVPWFGANTNSTDIQTDEGILVADMFENAPLEQIRSCIAGLCDEDKEQQIQLIYEAYATPKEKEHSENRCE